MKLQQKNKSNRLYKGLEIIDYRRRLRRTLVNAAARFLKSNSQWSEYFFELRFLLNRGLPIVEDHLSGAISNGAIDLALAWAEEWPSMNASQRKVCLQAQTVIAAELLRLVSEEMLQPRPSFQEPAHERDESWQGMGIPFAYVKAQNPPGRSDIHQQVLLEGTAHHREGLLWEKGGQRLPLYSRLIAAQS